MNRDWQDLLFSLDSIFEQAYSERRKERAKNIIKYRLGKWLKDCWNYYPNWKEKNAEYDNYVDKYKNYVREGQPQGPPPNTTDSQYPQAHTTRENPWGRSQKPPPNTTGSQYPQAHTTREKYMGTITNTTTGNTTQYYTTTT